MHRARSTSNIIIDIVTLVLFYSTCCFMSLCFVAHLVARPRKTKSSEYLLHFVKNFDYLSHHHTAISITLYAQVSRTLSQYVSYVFLFAGGM